MRPLPNRVTIWVLPAAAVLTTMHAADELWSGWDAGSRVTSSAMASVMVAPVALAFLAFALELQRMRWASPFTFVVGLFSGYSALGHFVDDAGMDGFRWTIVILQMAAALAIMLTSILEFAGDTPWKATRPGPG